MGVLGWSAATLLLVASVLLYGHALYSIALLCLGGVFGRRRPFTAPSGDLPRLVVLVTAHDEETVIGAAVQSHLAQQYPGEQVSVVVVADRCNDETAARARQAGALVYEREEGEPGKGPALCFGLAKIAEELRPDAVAVFDADNLSKPGCLSALGRRLAGEARIVQGFVDSSNPAGSWVAGSSALGFWAMAALMQAPREAIGLSCPLMGTAWAASLDVCVRALAGARALTDDLEMGARLALEGVRVAYEPRAIVLDEKPTRVGVAVKQRHRWMQGRWAVARTYIPRLVRKAIGCRDLPLSSRLRALDVAAQIISPSLLFTAVMLAVASLTTMAISVAKLPPGARQLLELTPPEVSLAAALLCFLLPIPAIARLRPPGHVWFYYLIQPLYLVLSLPLAISGFLLQHRSSWQRTEHGAEQKQT